MQKIAAVPETPRFPPPYHEVDIFAVQEAVIDSITLSSETGPQLRQRQRS